MASPPQSPTAWGRARANLPAAAWFGRATILAGLAIVAASAWQAGDVPRAPAAALAAAAIVCELLYIRTDRRSIDPADAHAFSFASGVHLAAALVLAPWPAVLVCVVPLVLVDRLRGSSWRIVAFNGSGCALATLAAAGAFAGLGGVGGALSLPRDFAAVAVAAGVYHAVHLFVMLTYIGLRGGSPARSMIRKARGLLVTTAPTEAALGVTLAVLIVAEPWAAALLAPLVVSVYQAHARLAALRRQTAGALESFASIVDERDPATFRHSERVAGYVRRLAVALRLPPLAVARLELAARLHDLGKVAVDASILRKPGKLDAEEWALMRRHPRLSARILRRFPFAAAEAQAAEYHHERFDGRGYFGVEASEVPLAAHFLIVADSYDAMTADRAYRAALPQDRALREIEDNAGTQFHPVLARAFVALERGEDPLREIDARELRALHDSVDAYLTRTPRRRRKLAGRPDSVFLAAIVASLAAVATGIFVAAAAAIAAALAAAAWRQASVKRTRRLAGELRAAAAEEGLDLLAAQLAHADSLVWCGIVSSDAALAEGSIVRECSTGGQAPDLWRLMSWLVAEGDVDRMPRASEVDEVGAGTIVALPLARDSAERSYFIGRFSRAPRGEVVRALAEAGDELRRALSTRPAEPEARLRLAS